MGKKKDDSLTLNNCLTKVAYSLVFSELIFKLLHVNKKFMKLKVKVKVKVSGYNSTFAFHNCSLLQVQ